MQQINQDISSGQFHNIYLLWGQEAYLRRQYRDKLKKALVSEDDTMNYTYREGKGISVPELIDQAETLPFFADRRVILVENSGLFKKGCDDLAEYLKECCETTVFVFVEQEIDRKTRIYKTVAQSGVVAAFEKQTPETLRKWAASRMQKEGFRITGRDMDHFLELVGNDMQVISTELEKLFSYCMGRDVITAEDIDSIVTRQVEGQIFAMIEAMSAGRQREAMKLYRDLLTLKEPPLRILTLIGRQFSIMLTVKALMQKGGSSQSIGKEINLAAFIAAKYMAQCRDYTMDEIKEALRDIEEADYAIKSGRMQDVMSVELLVVKYSSRKKRR